VNAGARPPGDSGTTPRRPPRSAARTVLSIASPLFFLPSALALADRDATVFGIPALTIYVFAAWFAGIVLVALTARGNPAE